LTGVLLALSASLAWGFADFGAGVSTRRASVFVVAAGMQAAGLVVTGLVLLATRPHVPTWTQLGFAALAGLLGVLGLSSVYRGLAVGTMGIVGPISTMSSLVPFAYGLARGERPAALQLAGVALAIVGVVGASLERHPEHGRRQIGTGVGLALLAPGGVGGALVGLGRAAPGGIAWAALTMRVAALPCFLALVAATRAAPPSRRLLPVLAAIGAVDAGATLLYAAAATRGLLSVVAVLASLYPVVIVALARVVLHERVARPQLAGVAVALTGVALISAG
jgi:drug/metabolite transporter (DMT)-like permease